MDRGIGEGKKGREGWVLYRKGRRVERRA